ncbi:transcription initiation factor IIF subunit alpha [[Candida] anglica]|uniref:Transcription initiation factor IIF subunit alpha n=1 Tax=[Candida] anglica TaxID=148631 RepID=A0ABP0E9I3_9ASCO
MSQPPVKTEPTVKAEPRDGIPASSGITPNNNSKQSAAADQGWQDIPLKCCTPEEVQDIRYHILKFQAKQNVDIAKNFTNPVRLHRKDPRNIQFQLTRAEIDKRKREQEELKLEAERLKLEEEAGAEGEEGATVDGVKQEGSQTPGEKPKVAGEADMSQVAPDGGARKPRKNLFKRKTRQINLMDDEKRKLRYEEYYPWVIEDYDGKNVFVGNYEAGSSDTQHVLFVFDKDGFKMVPAEKVYKFTPRNKYATLTLEEAEAKMEKNSSVPRWLMRHMEDQSTAQGAAPDQRFRNASPGSGSGGMGGGIYSGRSTGLGGSNGRLRTVIGGSSSNDRDSDHDDLDFDEEFADDEEAPIMDGDEEENKLSEQKLKKEMLKAAHFDGQSDAEGDDNDLDDLFETEKSRKVDKEGEKLRKVLNKTEGGVYESEDDDKLNPYLSKSDLESENESEDDEVTQVKTEATEENIPKPEQPRTIFAGNLGDGFVVIKAPATFLQNFPAGEWSINGRKRTSPAAESPRKAARISDEKTNGSDRKSVSPTPKASSVGAGAVDLNSVGPDGVLVTTKEVLDIVRDTPLTTKDLLQGLKNRVNAHKDNKQRIIAIVKQNLKLIDGKLVLKEDN